MAKGKLRYELSAEADADLEQVFDYSVKEFGFDKAIEYLTQIEDQLFVLTLNPEAGKQRNEIREGLRSLPSGVHLIFYRVLSDRIRIVRILHASRDAAKFFTTDLK